MNKISMVDVLGYISYFLGGSDLSRSILPTPAPLEVPAVEVEDTAATKVAEVAEEVPV